MKTELETCKHCMDLQERLPKSNGAKSVGVELSLGPVALALAGAHAVSLLHA